MSDVVPFLSVVIPTWNRARHLRGCLADLIDQDYPTDRWEIVVADDGSTDDTAGVAAAVAATSAVTVTHAVGVHGGINAARNTGVVAAQGDIVVFLDDDELAPPGHLRRIVAQLGNWPDVGGVGGPYLDRGDSAIPTCPTCELGASSKPLAEPTIVSDLFGGNMALRREVLDEVGPFDAELSGRSDELEWFRRADRSFLYDPSSSSGTDATT